jgi:hypothetical protein
MKNYDAKFMRRIATGIVLLLAAILIAVLGYNVEWTGLGQYNTPSGEIQRAKTLWDWFALMLIPLFIALGGFAINSSFQSIDRRRAERQSRIDRGIAADQMQEQALQHYLDRMSDLLLDRNLGSPDAEETVKIVARSRTLTTLRGLDPKRKGVVLRFLYSAHLISGEQPVVDLQSAKLIEASLIRVQFRGVVLRDTRLIGADLEGANLRDAHLERANLSGANLSNSQLKGTRFEGANLEGANFTGATIEGAYFAGANLRGAKIPLEQIKDAHTLKGTTMPDGTKRE